MKLFGIRDRSIPREPVSIKDQTCLLIVVLKEQYEDAQSFDWRSLKGKYRGKLSSVDEFIRLEQEEKDIEK